MSISHFDVIFAGGGTTACVVAGRLLEADPNLSVLVVESGQHTRDIASHYEPWRFYQHLAPESKTVSVISGKPSEKLNGRAPIAKCGRAIGGGSTVNFLAYVRGAASDYDDWEKLGNPGWSAHDLLPLSAKAETFTVAPDLPTHGYSGPTKISTGRSRFTLGEQFLEVGRKYDPKTPQLLDGNDFAASHGYAPWYKYIDPNTGRRSDTATNYLYPHSDNPRLQILVGKRVKRVIIENGQAVGIEYIDDAISCPEGTSDISSARASKLVVVSGGAFGSPAILERSGIGSATILEKNQVEVIVDLPGVGENFQDHYGAYPGFFVSADLATANPLIRGDSGIYEASLEEWRTTRSGPMAGNTADAFLKLRPSPKELESMGPEFAERWDKCFKNNPDKSVAMIASLAGWMGEHPDGREMVMSTYYLLYPDCVGHVHITSGEDANAPLDFDPAYLTSPSDLNVLTMLYKKMRELIRRLPSFRGQDPSTNPRFPDGSVAACKEFDDPVSIDAPDIVYTPEDDRAIEDFTRNSLQTTWHALGTCAMKPREKGGVVDARLNVYGVKGLKVADLSIVPSNVGNNTYSTALVIGEKAALLIAEDLGNRRSEIHSRNIFRSML